MSEPVLKLACQAYDRTLPIVTGAAKLPGFSLQIEDMTSKVPRMFAGMHAGEFDISEMSLAETVYDVSRGKREFVGVPVFPSKTFRHGFIYCQASSDVRGPEDLSGKRVGFPRLVQTASIWQRGALTDDYGVAADRTQFLYASIHHWDGDDDTTDITPRDGSAVPRRWRPSNASQTPAEQALADGELDAVATTVPYTALPDRERVRRVFADYRQAEIDYYRKTGVFPIMHMVAVRKSLVEQHPDLPAAVFRLFADSRALANQWLRFEPSLSLAWKAHYLDEERALFDADPWAYGLDRNAHIVDKFLAHCYDQGISARRMEPRELFDPSTWDLAE